MITGSSNIPRGEKTGKVTFFAIDGRANCYSRRRRRRQSEPTSIRHWTRHITKSAARGRISCVFGRTADRSNPTQTKIVKTKSAGMPKSKMSGNLATIP